jgi:hypothetical protein
MSDAMTDADADAGSEIGRPSGLVQAVLHLVSTGPVLLGAYTLAEMVAVDAVVDFLDEAPSTDALGEAVRSLAARRLVVVSPGSDQVQVRGDLGIALVFQQRARLVVDARVSGSSVGEPWRTLLLPQPEGCTLEILISALGVHELSLRATDQALERLKNRLPAGSAGPRDVAADAVLAASARSALVTVVRYRAQGSAETAELSTDVVLAEDGDRLHVFLRDPDEPARLVAQGLGADEARDLIAALSSVGRSTTPDAPPATGDGHTRAAASEVTARISERWHRLKSSGRRWKDERRRRGRRGHPQGGR